MTPLVSLVAAMMAVEGFPVSFASRFTVVPVVPSFVYCAAMALVPIWRFPLSVTVPALKFPEASRFTIVLAVFALVAAFAAFAPPATFAVVTPPTVATVGFG
jgi:hypothetical protein